MDISRRGLLKVTGAALGSGALLQSATTAAAARPPAYSFFNAHEAAFVEAAVARLIPADELGPGALEAGVPEYLDKQLGGAWGAGERLYRGGPWQAGSASQGYQLPFTPAELFRNALRAVAADVQQKHGGGFAALAPADQDAYLKSLQDSEQDLGGVPAAVFFQSLLSMTIEGYFGDPAYGGNKDMAAWKMIGFPGAYAEYYDLVDQHGLAYTRAPMSLAESGAGHIHPDPNIPADINHHGH